MQFKRELAEKIIRGEKFQTRRPVKPGEQMFAPRHARFEDAVFTAKHHMKWCSGQTYAVQPGRGKPALWYAIDENGDRSIWPYAHKPDPVQTWRQARILLKSIRCEDVRYISLPDVLAEGFKTRAEFFKVWCGFYDPAALKMHTEISGETVFQIADRLPKDAAAVYLDDWTNALKKRDSSLYQAWALAFVLAPSDAPTRARRRRAAVRRDAAAAEVE